MSSHEKAGAVPSTITLPASLPGIDIADVLRRIGNRPVLIYELLCEFEREQAGVLNQIRSLRDQGDLAGATRQAHSIKGLALNLGCTRLAGAAQALEAALKSGAADMDARLSAASVAFAEVQASVEALRSRQALPG